MRMVEKMARAMVAEDSGPEGSALFDIHWEEFGEGYMASARAAIKAMREPTEEMWAAAWLIYHPWGVNAPDPRDRPNAFDAMKEKTSALLSAMIDKALED